MMDTTESEDDINLSFVHILRTKVDLCYIFILLIKTKAYKSVWTK